MGSVSAVVLTYNKAHRLSDFIASLGRQLHAPDQVIVVDDASTDGTREILAEKAAPNWIVLRLSKNGGPAHARNVGLQYARGDYVVFLEADIEMRPDMLRLMRQALDGDPEASFAYCHYARRGRRSQPFRGRPWDREALLEGNYVSGVSMLRRAHATIRFAEGLRLHEDWHFWVRLAALGRRGVLVDQTLFEAYYGSDDITVRDAAAAAADGAPSGVGRPAAIAAATAPEDASVAAPQTPPLPTLKITCILTSYNRPHWLRHALRSLELQTYRNFELLLFDDSTLFDAAEAAAESDIPGLRVIRNRVGPEERRRVNRLGVNINSGLRLAKGDLICYLADDDYYYPTWFEDAARFFSERPDVVVAYGKLGYSNSSKMDYHLTGPIRWPGHVVAEPFERLDHNQVMHRRLDPAVPWPEDISTLKNPDAHYFRSLSAKYLFHPVRAFAAVKRVHNKNLQMTAEDILAGRGEGLRE